MADTGPFKTVEGLARWWGLSTEEMKAFLQTGYLAYRWTELGRSIPVISDEELPTLQAEFEIQNRQNRSKYTAASDAVAEHWSGLDRLLRFLLKMYTHLTSSGGLFYVKELPTLQCDAVQTLFHMLWELFNSLKLNSDLHETKYHHKESGHALCAKITAKKEKIVQFNTLSTGQVERDYTRRLDKEVRKVKSLVANGTGFQYVLELNGPAHPIDQKLADKLTQAEITFYTRMTRLDKLKMDSKHHAFNMKDQLWQVVLASQLAAQGPMPRADLLRNAREIGNVTINNLNFALGNLFDQALLDQLKIPALTEARKTASKAQEALQSCTTLAFNDIDDAAQYLEAEKIGEDLWWCPLLPNYKLFSWQLTGAWFLFKLTRNRIEAPQSSSSLAILGDDPGLGKSLQAILFIFMVIKYLDRNWNTLSEHQQKSWDKPMIIFAPAQVFEQLLSDFATAMDGNVQCPYRLYRYYGQLIYSKETDRLGKFIKPPMFRTHPVFQGERRYRNIILTSRETMVLRHGLDKEIKWYMARYNVEKQQAKTIIEAQHGQVHANFPLSLEGRFSLVLFDEAHEFENADNRSSDFAYGLKASMNICLTGTCLANGARGFQGYAKLANSEDLRRMWEEYAGNDYGENDEYPPASPFDLPEDDPRCLLRLSPEAYRLFVKGISAFKQGQLIKLALKEIACIRGLQTPTEPGSDRVIKSHIPSVNSSILEISHWPEVQRLYQELSRGLIKKLFHKSTSRRRKVDIDFPVLHQLFRISNWPWLLYTEYFHKNLHEYVDLNSEVFFEETFRTIRETAAAGVQPRRDYQLPPTDRIGMMDRLRREMPKLTLLSADLMTFVHMEHKNVLLYCQEPAECLIVLHWIRLMGIKAMILYRDVFNNAKRKQTLSEFRLPRNNSKPMVLVTTFGLLSKGMNLPEPGDVVIFFDTPTAPAIRLQCSNRLARLMNPHKTITLREYRIEGTFYDTVVANILGKAFANYLLHLNKDRGEMAIDDDGEVLDEWVWHNDRYWHVGDAEVVDLVANGNLWIYSSEDLLRKFTGNDRSIVRIGQN